MQIGLKVKYLHHTFNVTTSYRYLGVDIHSSLTFNDFFMTSYKKATGRLHLLNKLQFQLDAKAAVTIYRSLIIPVLTYCSVLSLITSREQTISSLQIHVSPELLIDMLIKPIQFHYHLPHACLFVRKCTDGKLCENFAEYFNLLSHEKRTRNASISLNLQSVRTEISKRSVYFSGAKISYLYRF